VHVALESEPESGRTETQDDEVRQGLSDLAWGWRAPEVIAGET
jgi:hypothetical protein